MHSNIEYAEKYHKGVGVSKKGQNRQEGVSASKKWTNSRPEGVGAFKKGQFGASWGRCIQNRDALWPEAVSESKIRAKRDT